MSVHGFAVAAVPWREFSSIALGAGWLLLLVLLAWCNVSRFSSDLLAKRRRGDRVFWVVLILIIVQWIDLATVPDVEWNPLHVPEEQFVGTYSDGEQTITFHSGGHFTAARISGVPESGDWERDNYNIHLKVEGRRRYMRHIQVEGRDHVLTRFIDDLDTWHGEVGLPKVAEAARR